MTDASHRGAARPTAGPRPIPTRRFGPLDRQVPVIGQGTWQFPRSGAALDRARAALRRGIELGMVHIDTAEMYGDGQSEEIIGEVIAGLPRESLFIVSKVLPSNASRRGTIAACEASLRRLGTDYLDVYLLHWRGSHALADTMRALEQLIDDGKIRALGVSNFDVADLDEARAVLERHPIACNQVLYHLKERGIERRVIPYCAQAGIAVVGYSPFGQGNFPAPHTTGGEVLARIGERYARTPRQVALAFLTRDAATFTIPKAATPAHVEENAGAGFHLDAASIAEIDRAFPVPRRDRLAML